MEFNVFVLILNSYPGTCIPSLKGICLGIVFHPMRVVSSYEVEHGCWGAWLHKSMTSHNISINSLPSKGFEHPHMLGFKRSQPLLTKIIKCHFWDYLFVTIYLHPFAPFDHELANIPWNIEDIEHKWCSLTILTPSSLRHPACQGLVELRTVLGHETADWLILNPCWFHISLQ